MKQNNTGMDNIDISEIRIIFEKDKTLAEEYSTDYFINWQPLYDLYIIDEKIFVIIEIPGVELKDITIYVGQNHMTVTGVKKPKIAEQSTKRQNVVFHNLEIAYGRFFRRIEFPLPVDPQYGRYKLKHGILTIEFSVLKEYIIPIEEN
ncbi:MAG: Hsp20/alpha crystallin family protein [candidate division WOR-3 bacterium]